MSIGDDMRDMVRGEEETMHLGLSDEKRTQDAPIYCGNCGEEMRFALTVLGFYAYLCDNNRCDIQYPVAEKPTDEELEKHVKDGILRRTRRKRKSE